jgi:hypothetical protein
LTAICTVWQTADHAHKRTFTIFLFLEKAMPQIDSVTVTNIQMNTTWTTNKQATAPDQPFPATYSVYVNASKNNQPPVGFLNNPAHQFVVHGRYLASGAAFTSGLLQADAAQSDPPLVFVFST